MKSAAQSPFRFSRSIVSIVLPALMLALASSPGLAATNWTVTAWNNLGMHCDDPEYSVFDILPPYNTINAQLIDNNGNLITNPAAAGLTLTYQAVADATGSINKTSAGKTDFWSHVLDLFGVALPIDVGLPVPGPNSYSMPGAANTPQTMGFESPNNWFVAYGIPITRYDDAGHTNEYPMMRISAKKGATVLASTDIVLPISDEMNCSGCHASGGNPTAQPVGGWVYNPNPLLDYRQNILKLHDGRHISDPVYIAALVTNGYNAVGLYTTALAGHSILCAACHLSEALPGSGLPGIVAFTADMHGYHAHVTDPNTGQPLDNSTTRTACYLCHPGATTRCLRGVMGNAVATNGVLAIECQNCHGNFSAVGSTTRTGWLNEPNCQACHTGDAVNNSGAIRFTSVFDTPGHMRVPANQLFATTPNAPATGFSLYRFSTGHGGLKCEACHGSTHAEYPSSEPNDNVTTIQHQGHVGMLVECDACHGSQPSTTTGGPHGMHPAGQTWVSRHPDVVEGSGSAQCQVCHGTDYRGTVLSRVKGVRTLTASFDTGSVTINAWRGFQISCYACHNGPSNDSRNPNHAPVAQNGSRSTSVNNPVVAALVATDADGNPLTYRVISQPANGLVGLIGSMATYHPNPGFVGGDSFTFAANDGQIDSNLGTISITVGGGGCTFALSATTTNVTSSSATGNFGVIANPGCGWTAQSNASWIHTTSTGTGNGTVNYTVDANTAANNRSGTITVQGQTFTVIQQGGGGCTYTISPVSRNIGRARNTGTVTVRAGAGCTWTASSNMPWLTITSGASGTGNGTVRYAVSVNRTGATRVGKLTIAGKTFTLTQSG